MFCSSAEEYVANPVIAKALDVIFLLHADHEQNASTSTVRLSSSSLANPFGCIAAGTAFMGASGGANEVALNTKPLVPDRIPEFVARAKDKNDLSVLWALGIVFIRLRPTC